MISDLLVVQDGADLLQRFGHVEAHVGHLVVGHLQDHRQHLLGGDVLTARLRQRLPADRGERRRGVSVCVCGGARLTLMQNRVVILWR